MIRVVLFDLDDTLFSHRGAVDDGLLATLDTLERIAHLDDAAEQRRWTELEEHHYARYLTGELDYLGQRRARARDFLAPYGTVLEDDEAETWFEEYLARYRAAFRLHDDALPCLDELERRLPGVRFGIITNGDLAFQTAKLEALGLTDRVEHLVTSGELGVAKPDPRIFGAALTLFGARPGEAAYIGDRLVTDAVGAARAGLTGVWLNRTDARPLPEHQAEAAALGVAVLPDLTGLPDLLAGR
ncbi:HAD family hydrolase [Amnibacterium sp. CER49]|uniref:HAD family hydrolase n=1 Tax=Amnibacterium sp. CER49 TaxID=3039161 RepID=UPI00244AF294|nr:HAD family hydrolase [Amnibacterium sp. CER49]MDH2443129.1 HAD family hydrolase [Amnibacterium sp. CER49]